MLTDYEELVRRVTDQDVNIYKHFKKGSTSTTKQAVHQIEITKQNIDDKLTKDADNLTIRAQKTLRDFNRVLDAFELNLINQIRDNILQKFNHHSENAISQLQDALKQMPDDQREEMIQMKKDMEDLYRCLESIKSKIVDLLQKFADSSSLRETFYGFYQVIFHFQSPQPPEANWSVSNYNMIVQKIKEDPDMRATLLDFIGCISDFCTDFFSTTSYFIDNPETHATKTNPSLAIVDDEIRAAINYLIQFLESAANGNSIIPTIASYTQLKDSMELNGTTISKELGTVAEELKVFLNDSLSKPESGSQSKNFNSIIENIQETITGEYSKEMTELRDNFGDFLYALANYPGMNQLSQEMSNVIQNMKIDTSSTADDVLKDIYCFLTDVFPVILTGLDIAPVPRIETRNENFELILDNLRIALDYIVPSKIHLRSDTSLDQLKVGVSFKERIHLTMKHINFSAYNIAFYYNKKSGLLKKKDIGLLNLREVGLNVNVILGFDTTSDQHSDQDPSSLKSLVARSRINIENVEVDVQTLKMKFHDTKHDSLYIFFYPIIRRKVKRLMAKLFSKLVRDALIRGMALDAKDITGFADEKEDEQEEFVLAPEVFR